MSNPDDFLEDPFGYIEELPDKPISARPTEEYATENKQEYLLPQLEADVDESQDTQSSRAGKVTHLLRRFSPVLVPLPFAILVFLFSIPFALRGQAFLPLMPLAVLLIALVVMQGTLLYYLGSNDTYWTLVVIIGYALFVVVGTLANFGLGASLILLFLLLGIGTLLARRSIRQVPEGSIDIVKMGGKYARTLYPGLNFKMPWEKVSGRFKTIERIWTTSEQTVKISRDQDVKLVATISYQLVPEDAHIAVLNVKDWETSLQKLFVATLLSVINELTPSDFISWPQRTQAQTSVDINTIDASTKTPWDRINEMLERSVQDQVATWGVLINFVLIQDVALIPNLAPMPVQPFFASALADEPIDSQPTEEYPLEESRSVVYPPMEPLLPKPPPPPPQYPVQEQVLIDLDAMHEEALTTRFAIGKLIDYILLLLLVLELIFLTRLLLKLIGADPNNMFAGFLYGLSNFLLFPFSGIAPSVMIHPLNQPLEISTLVGMFVYFLIFFVLVRFLIILISGPKFPKSEFEDLDLKPPQATRERAFESKFALTQVRSFYENTRGQFKPWLFFSVIAITLGTLCIASIYIIPYLGKFFPISVNTTTIITTMIAGGSLYIIALLSFLQNRAASKQLNSYYTDKLIEAEKISQLTKLASRIPVSEAQEHMNEKIISQILLPLEKAKIGKDTFKTASDEIPKLGT